MGRRFGGLSAKSQRPPFGFPDMINAYLFIQQLSPRHSSNCIRGSRLFFKSRFRNSPTSRYSRPMAQGTDNPPQLRGPPPGATAPPDHVQTPQVYEIFHGSKPEDRDGSLSTASPETPGGSEQKPNKRPSITDGIKTIKGDDFFSVHKIPCAKQGYLTGIGAGFTLGAGRYIAGGLSAQHVQSSCD